MPGRAGQTFALPVQQDVNADLFSTQEQRDSAKLEKVVDVPLSEIDDFPDHPFQVRQDDAMQSMVDSVKAVGIQTPALARQKEDGRYELISGHRRKLAATLAGLETMPLIVRDLTRDEAIIAMVDANLQRETILPSEKALSYKMKLEAVKRQGARTDLTSAPVVQKLEGKTSREMLGEQTGDSHEQVRRYIRLTELAPQLLEMVDSGKIAFRPAVELSYLSPEQQASLLAIIETDEATPSLAQAQKMKQFAQNHQLSDAVILSIMTEEKPNQVEQFKMPKAKISRFFPDGATAQQMEETIIRALELLQRQRERQKDAR